MSDLDRRSVLKAGVVLWSVPVISMAAAAPAFAASGADLSTSTITTPVVTGNGSNRDARFTVTIINSGGATTALLRVRITFSGTAPTGQAVPAGGWTVAPDPLNPNALLYTSTSQLAGGGASKVVSFIITPGNNSTTAIVELLPGGSGTGKTFPTLTL